MSNLLEKAQELRRIRIEFGYTIMSLSNEIQMSQITIGRAERGHKVSKTSVKMIAEFFGIPISSISNFDD